MNRGEIIKMEGYSASYVAKWFLNYNRLIMSESDADLISNLKLQKLLYYAQGCFLAYFDRPLFNEPIVAWEHGPVVESVYQEYKANRANGIVFDDDFNSEFNNEEESLLEEVYNTFAKYSAWGLRNMTHQETPWLNTQQSDVIDNEVIKKYFKENYLN